MKSFQQFITEAKYTGSHQELDDVKMSKRADTPLKVGRIGDNRKKSSAEKKRVKAVGGGKTAPAKTYKDRKDIGTQKPRSQREQQPEKERGSAADAQKAAALAARRKAAQERIAARKSGGSAPVAKKTPTASELLATKKRQTVDPKYKQVKASGMTQSEREAVTKKGEKKLRDIRLQTTGKTKESELKYPITKKEIARRRKASK